MAENLDRIPTCNTQDFSMHNNDEASTFPRQWWMAPWVRLWIYYLDTRCARLTLRRCRTVDIIPLWALFLLWFTLLGLGVFWSIFMFVIGELWPSFSWCGSSWHKTKVFPVFSRLLILSCWTSDQNTWGDVYLMMLAQPRHAYAKFLSVRKRFIFSRRCSIN